MTSLSFSVHKTSAAKRLLKVAGAFQAPDDDAKIFVAKRRRNPNVFGRRGATLYGSRGFQAPDGREFGVVRRVATIELIPEVPFIVLNLMSDEERQEFLLERFHTMMFALIRDVFDDVREI